jgi:hypothetical protein
MLARDLGEDGTMAVMNGMAMPAGRRERIARMARFVRHIPPRKLIGWVAHKIGGRMVARWPGLIHPLPVANPFEAPSLTAFASVWSASADRFKAIDGLERGRFETKSAEFDFGSVEAMDWTPRFNDQPELANWAYDFASFGYAPILVERDAAAGIALLARMLDVLERRHAIGTGRRLHFVWDPIVVANRILSLSGVGRMAVDSGVSAAHPALATVAAHVARCSAYLDRFAERYLGYNHAAFALVALAAADIAVHGGVRATRLSSEALEAIEAQVLADGFQAERAPTYHVHVLLLLQALLALGALKDGLSERGRALEQRMRDALAVMVHPDGEIALFNDSAIEDSVPPSMVGWRPDQQPRTGATMLPNAGYARLAAGPLVAIFDAGEMGPSDVIGHGHGDFLACEVSLGGERVIVDPGVFAYSAGPLRDRTRSAASHNGPRYAGLEPAEFFGAWRVGRRGKAWFLPSAELPRLAPFEAAGLCDGYDRHHGRVLRYCGLSGDGNELLVFDLWRGGRSLIPRLSFLIPGRWSVTSADAARIALRHANGELAVLETCGLSFGPVFPGQWRPKGPMVDARALDVQLDPPTGYQAVHGNLLRLSATAAQQPLERRARALREHFSPHLMDQG